MTLVKIIGSSMSPCLNEGDYILTHAPRSLRPGRVYVIAHSDLGRIIKRLESINTDGRCLFRGDNIATSTPSAVIAPVSPQHIIGRAFLAITKNGFKRL